MSSKRGSERVGEVRSERVGEWNWIAFVLQDPDYRIIPNVGGGDCLFRVVSQATGISHKDLRALAASCVTQEEFEVKKALSRCKEYQWMIGITQLSEYKKMLMYENVWGDGESVEHLQDVLDCKLLILSQKSENLVYRTVSLKKKAKFYILVNYIESSHFELVTWRGKKWFYGNDVPIVIKLIFGKP